MRRLRPSVSRAVPSWLIALRTHGLPEPYRDRHGRESRARALAWRLTMSDRWTTEQYRHDVATGEQPRPRCNCDELGGGDPDTLCPYHPTPAAKPAREEEP